MTEADVATNECDAVIRSLALRAVGRTGADIERLIREARQTARRQHRPLSYDDVVAKLDTGKPARSQASRWRRAVHEAGHAIARHHLGLGTVDLVTINGIDGESFVDGYMDCDAMDAQSGLMDRMVSLLAGRAAEEVVLGKPGLGSGGSAQSDLAKATEIGMALETVLGTSSVHPLVHVTTVYPIDQSITNGISKAVNSRLEETYGKSLQIMKRFEADVSKIATRLVTYETLDKVELSNYLTSIEGPESL